MHLFRFPLGFPAARRSRRTGRTARVWLLILFGSIDSMYLSSEHHRDQVTTKRLRALERSTLEDRRRECCGAPRGPRRTHPRREHLPWKLLVEAHANHMTKPAQLSVSPVHVGVHGWSRGPAPSLASACLGRARTRDVCLLIVFLACLYMYILTRVCVCVFEVTRLIDRADGARVELSVGASMKCCHALHDTDVSVADKQRTVPT